MTLVCAWVRKAGKFAELVVASDSRLTGGITWDHGQKIFPLRRGDAVLAFAGDTFFAYPLILQALRYVEDFDSVTNRSIPLEEVKGHLERVMSQLLLAVRDLPVGQTDIEPDFTLLLGGYSVAARDWRIWVSTVTPRTRRLQFIQAPRVGGVRGSVFVGSGSPRATARLRTDRAATWKARAKPAPMSWEPFDILRDLIRSGNERSVGGPIQLVTVHQQLTAMPYAVFWPSRPDGCVTLFGRPLLSYERTQRLAVDPDTHDVYKLWDYLDEPTLKSKQDPVTQEVTTAQRLSSASSD